MVNQIVFEKLHAVTHYGSPCRLWLLAGFSVRLTIPIETSNGAVTAVPTSAVSLAADGTSRVLVDRGGKQGYVTVQPGLSTGGYVEVKTPDRRLAPGQLVVVGYKAAEPTAVK